MSRWLLTSLCVILALSLQARPRPNGDAVRIRVDQAELAWAESKLTQKLLWQLGRANNWSVMHTDPTDTTLPPFPEADWNADSLMSWGREAGGRYLLYVAVQSERLERKKTFSIPLILHRYETVGVIEGELRLLDVQRGRVLLAEPFEQELRARQSFQGDPDENRHEAGLFVPAPEKQLLFSDLEDKLVKHITSRLKSSLRGRR